MKTYYSLSSQGPRHSLGRSLAEPVFVLCCVGVFCTLIWLTGTPAPMDARHDLVAVHQQNR